MENDFSNSPRLSFLTIKTPVIYIFYSFRASPAEGSSPPFQTPLSPWHTPSNVGSIILKKGGEEPSLGGLKKNSPSPFFLPKMKKIIAERGFAELSERKRNFILQFFLPFLFLFTKGHFCKKKKKTKKSFLKRLARRSLLYSVFQFIQNHCIAKIIKMPVAPTLPQERAAHLRSPYALVALQRKKKLHSKKGKSGVGAGISLREKL